jgi:hypothetical protein
MIVLIIFYQTNHFTINSWPIELIQRYSLYKEAHKADEDTFRKIYYANQ